jgi:Bacterial regulatory proteins, gntR family
VRLGPRETRPGEPDTLPGRLTSGPAPWWPVSSAASANSPNGWTGSRYFSGMLGNHHSHAGTQKRTHVRSTAVVPACTPTKAGDLPPGGRLPAERELAAEYGVSLATGRHAVKVLREWRLVITQPVKRTFVRAEPR